MGESPSGVFSVERLGAICHIAFDPSVTQCMQALAQSARIIEALHKIDQDPACEVLIISGLRTTTDDIKHFGPGAQSSGDPVADVHSWAGCLLGSLRPLTVTVVTSDKDDPHDGLLLASDLVLAIESSETGHLKVKWAACPGRGGSAKLSAVVGRFNELEPDILRALEKSAVAEPYALTGAGERRGSSKAFAW